VKTTTVLKPTSAPKIATAPKPDAAAQKVTAAKVIIVAASRAVTDAAPSKAAAAGQRGAPGVTKAGILKLKARMKKDCEHGAVIGEDCQVAESCETFILCPSLGPKSYGPLLPAHELNDD
jgi:NAD(P)H-hydrate repair Nnr-like enzyme with NAD(P)H-hydrate dehydratase domain